MDFEEKQVTDNKSSLVTSNFKHSNRINDMINCCSQRRTSKLSIYIMMHNPKRRKLFPSIANSLLLMILSLFILSCTNGFYSQHQVYSPFVDADIVSSSPTQTEQPRCQATNSFVCNINNYTTMLPFQNSLGHSTIEAATAELNQYAILAQNCPPNVRLFLCSLFLPVCVANYTLKPCREICEETDNCISNNDRNLNMKFNMRWKCEDFSPNARGEICVFNQARSGQENEPPRQPELTDSSVELTVSTPPPSLSSIDANVTSLSAIEQYVSPCDKEMFDCRLPDRVMCLDATYVCDGSSDCRAPDDNTTIFTADEIVCAHKCPGNLHYCDDRCMISENICNGKVDCISGLDEQGCNYWSEPISIFCLFIIVVALLFIVTWIIVRFRGFIESELHDPNKEPPHHQPYIIGQDSATITDLAGHQQVHNTLHHRAEQDSSPNDLIGISQDHAPYKMFPAFTIGHTPSLDQPKLSNFGSLRLKQPYYNLLNDNQLSQSNEDPNLYEHLYQDLTVGRIDYEPARCYGGLSNCSSEFYSGSLSNMPLPDSVKRTHPEREVPPAPPPTPNPYSFGSIYGENK